MTEQTIKGSGWGGKTGILTLERNKVLVQGEQEVRNGRGGGTKIINVMLRSEGEDRRRKIETSR